MKKFIITENKEKRAITTTQEWERIADKVIEQDKEAITEIITNLSKT